MPTATAASPAFTKDEFPFFKLPQELRDKIYEDCDGEVTLDKKYFGAPYVNSAAITVSTLPKLRLVSKQFKDEYETECARLNRLSELSLKIKLHETQYPSVHLGGSLRHIMSKVSVIHLTLHLTDDRWDEASFSRFIDSLESLNLVNLTVHYGTKASCVNGYVMVFWARKLLLNRFTDPLSKRYDINLACVGEYDCSRIRFGHPLYEALQRSLVDAPEMVKYRATVRNLLKPSEGIDWEVIDVRKSCTPKRQGRWMTLLGAVVGKRYWAATFRDECLR